MDTSLIQTPDFRRLLLQNWRQVLQHPQYGPALRTYCVVCGQWVSMQTCKHRLRAGAQVRHRLLRVLHSAGLRVRQRAILYQACVRSSFLYGQHAVGVTFGVLRKLEAQDAKNLRGIARSPAHLWHERSQTLRARLGLRSVHHMLVKLYQNRGRRCLELESRNWFLGQWSWLHTAPTAQLTNSGNVCYVNAVAQALAWLGACSERPRDCYGRAAVALQKVLALGKHTLPGSLPWMPVLTGWPQLHRQQDAGSFCAHLLAYAQPPAYPGEWQARLADPCLIVDSGPLLAPIPVEVQGPDLQAVIDHWSNQHTVHGLYEPGGALVLQLKRYASSSGETRKCITSVCCRPGERIGLPVFLDSKGLDTRTETYRIVSCVFHTGHSLDSGHYQAALCTPGAEVVSSPQPCTPPWSYRICDDNRKPRQSRTKEIKHIDSNAYLIGLLRDPGGA